MMVFGARASMCASLLACHNSRLIEVTFTTVLTTAPLALPLHAGDLGYGLGSRHFVLLTPFKLRPVCPYAVQNDR